MNKLFGLQYLRAIAAIVVIIHHAQSWIPQLSDPQSYLYTFHHIKDFGQIGVDIFFVISGFIITSILCHTEFSFNNAWTFVKKRIIRVVPIYWIYLSLTLCLIIPYHDVFTVENLNTFKNYLLALFFIPKFSTTGDYIPPLLQVGWTLTLEVYFYISASLFFLFFRRYWFTPFVVFIVLCVYVLNFDSSLFKWIMSHIYLMEFVGGLVISLFYFRCQKIPPVVSLILLAIGLLFLVYSVYLESSLRLFYVRFIASMCLVLSALYLEPYLPKNNFLSAMGDASYTLYLSHTIIFNVIGIIQPKLFAHSVNAYLLVSYMCLIAMIAGFILYRVIEVPLLRYLRQYAQ